MIFLMGFQMLGQVVDTLSQKRDLNFRGSGILLGASEGLDDFLFSFLGHGKKPP